jgi:tetratricopeptide (TPR) repeat protein
MNQTLDEAPRKRGGGMKYTLQALSRRRLLFPALALGGLLLLAGCATSPYQKHTKRGYEYQKKLDYVAAVKEYREAVHLKPNDAKAHYNLAYTLEQQGQDLEWVYRKDGTKMYDEAISEFREAIRLKPDDADAHCNLGVALSQEGKTDGNVAKPSD